MNRDVSILMLACRVFERQGCKRSSLIARIQANRLPVTVWLLGARLCELWHDDWETWIYTEGPLPEESAPFFEGKWPDDAVLTTWLDIAVEKLAPTAEYAVTTRLLAPIKGGLTYRPIRRPQRVKHRGGVNA